MNELKRVLRTLVSRENLFALLLFLVIVFAIIMTADTSPQWIYQGF